MGGESTLQTVGAATVGATVGAFVARGMSAETDPRQAKPRDAETDPRQAAPKAGETATTAPAAAPAAAPVADPPVIAAAKEQQAAKQPQGNPNPNAQQDANSGTMLTGPVGDTNLLLGKNTLLGGI